MDLRSVSVETREVAQFEDQIDVVLPCLNEAGALPGVLRALPPGFRAIVVDNGSTDDSPRIAAELGAKVVSESRRGYGAAVHTGLEYASSEIVCFIDADGSLDPGELIPLVDAVVRGADLAAGRRVPVTRGAWPWHARAGNLVLAALLRRQDVRVHDIAPMRAARRKTLLDLRITDRAFGYPLELLIKAGRAGLAIEEFDVGYRPRAAGTRSKVSGSLRGTLRATRDMAMVLATRESVRTKQSA
jgi:glycosyltransferase involved in cell wall biosynthesis